MFTGIIKEIGSVDSIRNEGSVKRLSIRADALLKAAKIGDSISVDGACLTVTKRLRGIICFDVMHETFSKTTLGFLRAKDSVNLEPALELTGEGLSGHLVSGHIDEIGIIKNIAKTGSGTARFTVAVKPESSQFLVLKGSVAINGISLTVNRVDRNSFDVDIIPHTLSATTMLKKKAGSRVNIEFDMIGKYVISSSVAAKPSKINKDFLKEHGFA